MSELVCMKAQEEYQDDFERDLDWLISEESRSQEQVVSSVSDFCFFFFLFYHSPLFY